MPTETPPSPGVGCVASEIILTLYNTKALTDKSDPSNEACCVSTPAVMAMAVGHPLGWKGGFKSYAAAAAATENERRIGCHLRMITRDLRLG